MEFTRRLDMKKFKSNKFTVPAPKVRIPIAPPSRRHTSARDYDRKVGKFVNDEDVLETCRKCGKDMESPQYYTASIYKQVNLGRLCRHCVDFLGEEANNLRYTMCKLKIFKQTVAFKDRSGKTVYWDPALKFYIGPNELNKNGWIEI